jgi:phosphate transport system protein
MTRALYDQELKDLRSSVVAMASMVDKAINNAVAALVQRDVSMAQQVVADDRAINEHRWRTEEHALLVIATQAPMASDLRMIAAVIHIVTDLERMADHAAGIAKIALQTADQLPLKPLVDIPRMSEIARTMLHDAITAFIEDDQAAARAIVARDDEVDALYEQIYRELLTFMLADPTTIDQATHLLWAAHNLERIADRVTNICERVVFAATGQLEELAVSTY